MCLFHLMRARRVNYLQPVNNVIYPGTIVILGDLYCGTFIRGITIHDNDKLGRNQGKIKTKDQQAVR